MPDENDQQANLDEDKKRNRKKNGNGLHHVGDVDAQAAAVAKPKREPKLPAESPRTWEAPEVERVAYAVMTSGLPHMGVLKMNPKVIAFVFSNAEREPDPQDLAKVMRFNSTYSYAFEGREIPKFVMRVAAAQWDRLTEEERYQALYYYLLHIGFDDKQRWKVERPEIVAFGPEIDAFKNNVQFNKGLKKARQLGLFDGVASIATVGAEREPISVQA